MSNEKDDFSKDVEAIFRKTVEINKQYLKQGTALVKEFGSSGRELKNLKPFQPDVMLSAFTAFTKMNLDHYQNMMDLSFAIAKKAFEPASGTATNYDDENPIPPSFVLSETVFAGQKVHLQFLLDNVKNEEAQCQLINTEYINEADPNNSLNLPTTFEPQSFQLPSGISQAVEIHIEVNNDVSLGTYESKVRVLGFEPAYFLIRLTIAEQPVNEPSESRTNKSSGNGRRKKQ